MAAGKNHRMKIAALIQAHHRPEQLSLLLDRLGGELWSRFVHVDRKTDIAMFAGLRDKAVFLDRRVRVNWAGRSQVEACLLLMREAIGDPTVTHFYHMSGQCYPVKTDRQIRDHLASMPPGAANFLSLEAMPVSHKPLERFTQRYFHDIRPPLLRKIVARSASLLPDQQLAGLCGIQLFGGSAWWLFERDTVEKMLRFVADNPWYWRLFRHSSSPDEMFFHSLIAPLGITVGGESPTAAMWIPGRDNPEAITPAMHEDFVRGPKLFARKYDHFHPALASGGAGVGR